MNIYKKYFWILITASVLILDRVTKVWVLNHLPLEEPIKILPILNLFFTYNPGAAFSFLNKAGGWQEWLFIAIAIGVTIFIIIWALKITIKEPLLKTALALVLGGTLGNLYDRIAYHKVIDFIDFFFRKWHYPIFNIADSAICIGAILLLIDIIYKEKNKKMEKKTSEDEKKKENKKKKRSPRKKRSTTNT